MIRKYCIWGALVLLLPAFARAKDVPPRVFIPQFSYGQGSPSVLSGSCFVVQDPRWQAVVITAADNADYASPEPLAQVLVTVGGRDTAVARIRGILNMSGKPRASRGGTMAGNFIILPALKKINPRYTLALDGRPGPEMGEAVELHIARANAAGFEVVPGVVQVVKPDWIGVGIPLPDVDFSNFQGAPAVSATTGKVIGIITRTRKISERTRPEVFLTTVAAMQGVLADTRAKPVPFKEFFERFKEQ